MRLFVFLVTVAILGFAPAPFPRAHRPPRNEAMAMLGHWEFVVWEANGSSQPIYQRLEIRHGKVAFVNLNGGRQLYAFTMHPKYSPRGFDWKARNEHYAGSYLLDGDTLKFILKKGDNLSERPTDFNGKAEYRLVLKRTRRPE